MNESKPIYHELEVEETWVEYLRTRLPFCFMEISQVPPQGRPEHFELSGPELLTGFRAAERHNFWLRGNAYYMTGKLMDYYSMTQAGRHYRMEEVLKLLTGNSIARFWWPSDTFTFYNSIQMEKVWGFVQENHLDRERVMMTNILLSLELCLKAVMTHANFEESGTFKFSAGHDVVKLFEGLPSSLRKEIETGVEGVCEGIRFVQKPGRDRRQGDIRPELGHSLPATKSHRKGSQNQVGRNYRQDNSEFLHGLSEQQRSGDQNFR